MPIKQYYEKSQSMKGNKNHNYGTKKGSSWKQKVSSTYRRKIGLTDELIHKIREEFVLCMDNKIRDISIKYGFTETIISNIKNRSLVCSHETPMPKKSKRECNIAKRKVSVQEILHIIDLLCNKKKVSCILDDTKQLFENSQVTLDIIKNIKCKIKINVLPFYKDEVETNTLNYYLNIVKEYSTYEQQ